MKFEAIFIALLFPWTSFCFPEFLTLNVFLFPVFLIYVPLSRIYVPRCLVYFLEFHYWAAGALRVPCSLPWIHDVFPCMLYFAHFAVYFLAFLLFPVLFICFLHRSFISGNSWFISPNRYFIVSGFPYWFSRILFFPISPGFFQGSEFLCIIFPWISSAPLCLASTCCCLCLLLLGELSCERTPSAPRFLMLFLCEGSCFCFGSAPCLRRVPSLRISLLASCCLAVWIYIYILIDCQCVVWDSDLFWLIEELYFLTFLRYLVNSLTWTKQQLRDLVWNSHLWIFRFEGGWGGVSC